MIAERWSDRVNGHRRSRKGVFAQVNRKVAKQVRVSLSAVSRLEAWFPLVLRDLPWRNRRTPWRVFVSEVMLQQTQASRVAEKFPAFVRQFPTPKRLAQAPEQDVLALWQGLGYYRRAKNLQAAAKIISTQFGGRVPSTVQELQSLPGIGRYSAGAIASIAFHQAAPIVDGNVARVFSRLADRRESAKDKIAQEWLWSTAEKCVRSAKSAAVLNEALMELGATVCVPKNPRCMQCPVRACCAAFKANSQEFVPLKQSSEFKTLIQSMNKETVKNISKNENVKNTTDMRSYSSKSVSNTNNVSKYESNDKKEQNTNVVNAPITISPSGGSSSPASEIGKPKIPLVYGGSVSKDVLFVKTASTPRWRKDMG